MPLRYVCLTLATNPVVRLEQKASFVQCGDSVALSKEGSQLRTVLLSRA